MCVCCGVLIVNGPTWVRQAAGGELDHDISTWELKADEITFTSHKLGEGSFGSVVEGKLRGKPVAIKTMYVHPLEAAIFIFYYYF